MGVPVIIYGKSGSGKTRSLKFFGEDEIFYVNIEKKMLPFKSKFKYELKTDNVETIKKQLAKMPMKTAVIDDVTYIMVNNYMRRRRNKEGTNSFDLYDDIGDYIWGLFEFVKNDLPEDVIVYFIMHEEESDYGSVKIRTIGKLLDNKVVPEGIVTICLRCVSDNGVHNFRTKTAGNDITKVPEDLLDKEYIDNNLKAVDTAIREFYGMNNSNNNNAEKEQEVNNG